MLHTIAGTPAALASRPAHPLIASHTTTSGRRRSISRRSNAFPAESARNRVRAERPSRPSSAHRKRSGTQVSNPTGTATTSTPVPATTSAKAGPTSTRTRCPRARSSRSSRSTGNNGFT